MARTKMQGLEKTLAIIDAMPAAVKKAAQTELYKSAGDLVAGMQRAAHVKSGTLRSTIRVESGQHELQIKVVAGGRATTKRVRKGADADFDYARGVEFGHVAADGKHVPADPFFFPVYRRKKGDMKRRMKTAVGAAATKKWKGS